MSRSPESGNALGMRAWRNKGRLLRGEFLIRNHSFSKSTETKPAALVSNPVNKKEEKAEKAA